MWQSAITTVSSTIPAQIRSSRTESIDNREDGFILGEYTSSNVVANVAKRNGKAGFNIFNAYGSILLANVAHRNGRFGFMIHVDDCPDCFGDGVITSPVRLSNNVATCH